MIDVSALDLDCLVVGVDGSHESAGATAIGVRLARSLGARLIAVHAIGLQAGAIPVDTPRFDRFVAEHSDGLELEMLHEYGPPVLVLPRVAAREGAGLIIVGSRGAGRAGSTLGSTAFGLIESGEFPILVLPA